MPTNCKNLDSSNNFKVNGLDVPAAGELSWNASNSSSGLAQLIPSGDPTDTGIVGYDILNDFLEANETFRSNSEINFKDTFGNPKSTILDEINNKFLFPSNNKTFGLDSDTGYVSYKIRIVLIFDMSAVVNSTTKFYLRLRRVVDDSIIFSKGFIQSDFTAQSGIIDATTIETWVRSETDPFVVDGTYLDLLNDSNSTGTVTLQDVSVVIFRG